MITYAELTDKHNFLTNREYIALHNTLSLDRIEALVEMEDAVSWQDGVLNYLDEAGGSFPKEDFLQDTINNLRDLSKLLQGEDNDELTSIIEQVEGIQVFTAQESEYGLEQLKSAKAAIHKP